MSLCRGGIAFADAGPQAEPTRLTLSEAADAVRRRQLSPVELTSACLRRIDSLDGKVNSFITVMRETAMAAAQASEAEIRRGQWRGPLHGIPIAVKDSIDVAGVPTTAGSASRRDFVAGADAEVIRRLRAAGAVIIGKLNMFELALSPESFHGPVHNPYALDYECGFTSSGPGAAVAADFCFAALGTDTGGSTRLPASACGVVGLKPTYGLVSNRGVVPLTKSLDHVGILTKTVIDAALVLQTIAGHDPGWPESACEPPGDYLRAARESAARLRFATPGGAFFENLDPEVAELTHQAIAHLATLAIRVQREVTVPRYAEIEAGLWPEFLASNAELIADRRELFGPILRGMVSSSEPSASALDYLKAMRALGEARANADSLIGQDVDLLVMPTWKRLPMRIEERQRTWPTGTAPAPEPFLQELRNTQPFNILGVPAVSVPCGVSHAGLPVGLQIVGKRFQEGKVLCMARAFEQAHGGRLRPKSFS